jgi:ketosteroid isomerase-like protein
MLQKLQSPESPAELTRRGACALFALGLASVGAAADSDNVPPVAKQGPLAAEIAAALAERFALKRRAYQTGDAQLLRSFYDEDIVIVGEGMKPLLGIEPVIAAYEALLPKRRDIEISVLRFEHSPDAQSAWQFVRFVAFPKDPAEKPPVATFLFLWRRKPTGWRCGVESLLLQDLSLIPGFAITSPATEKKGAV